MKTQCLASSPKLGEASTAQAMSQSHGSRNAWNEVDSFIPGRSRAYLSQMPSSLWSRREARWVLPHHLTQVFLSHLPKMSEPNLAGSWAFVWASDSFPILHLAAALAASDPSFFELKALSQNTPHLQENDKSCTFSNHCVLTLLLFLLQ